VHCGYQRFEPRETAPAEQPRVTHEALQAAAPIQPQQARERNQCNARGQQRAGDAHRAQARRAVLAEQRAALVDDPAVGHLGRAHAFAGPARKAAVKMRLERAGLFDGAARQALQQSDAAARRIGLVTGFAVGRARGQAQSALDAQIRRIEQGCAAGGGGGGHGCL
jgi:hypothetical protein